MTKEGYAKLTWMLAIVASVLAIAAPVIDYVRQGEVNLRLTAAGLFLLAFGFGAKSRIGR